VLPVKLPAAQLAQVPIPEPVVYWPAGQLVQAEKGVNEYFPAAHREQTERPVVPVKLPAAQVSQNDCPAAAMYLPAVQGRSHNSNGDLERNPTSQEEHADAPAAE
jgi:hypothetical protein